MVGSFSLLDAYTILSSFHLYNITLKLLSIIGNIIRRTNVRCIRTTFCKLLQINIEHIIVQAVFVTVTIRVFVFIVRGWTKGLYDDLMDRRTPSRSYKGIPTFQAESMVGNPLINDNNIINGPIFFLTKLFLDY